MMNYIGHLNYLKGCGIIPNFSELERIYNKDRRTLKKYYDNGGIPKRKKRDEKTIGLLVCKNKNEVLARYALESTTQPLGISSFELSN